MPDCVIVGDSDLCDRTKCLLGGAYVPCVHRMPGGNILSDSGLCGGTKCLLGGADVPSIHGMPGGRVTIGDSGLCCCVPVCSMCDVNCPS